MFGFGWPKSPKAMLEARYRAHVKGDIDFIIASCHPDVRRKQDREEIERWSRESKWLGLKVEEHTEEGDVGHVRFTCRYMDAGGHEVLHSEIAEFRKAEDDRWYFYDSKRPSTTMTREEPKVGRNDPCPCGSGRKYKKCCGA
jgi:SEC-C motif-containing protein